MDRINKDAPLVVVTGPTASGKTSVSIKLAKKYGGEIVCCDSRTIYKDMNIGTAKPNLEEQDGVVHHGLDLVEPGDYFTVADFKKYADEKIANIRKRGKVPFLVGGSGLYIDAVVFDYDFGSPADFEKRQKLEEMSLEDLHDYCLKNNIKLPENKYNKRYVIRQIEQGPNKHKRKREIIDNVIIVGITTEKTLLENRMKKRVGIMFDQGVVEEARILGEKYGWDSEAVTGNVYPILHEFLDKKIDKKTAMDRIVISDRQLAKKQRTWMKRNEHIKWLGLEDAYKYLDDQLASAIKS